MNPFHYPFFSFYSIPQGLPRATVQNPIPTNLFQQNFQSDWRFCSPRPYFETNFGNVPLVHQSFPFSSYYFPPPPGFCYHRTEKPEPSDNAGQVSKDQDNCVNKGAKNLKPSENVEEPLNQNIVCGSSKGQETRSQNELPQHNRKESSYKDDSSSEERKIKCSPSPLSIVSVLKRKSTELEEKGNISFFF